MTTGNTARRRRGSAAASLAAFASAVMLVFTTWSFVTASAAGTNAGNAQVVDPSSGQPLNSGGSSTNFTLKLPQGAACTGDSANQGYRVQSYMVPSSVDPATLQYGSSGPTPAGVGANFRQPLYDTNSTPYVNAQTANASPSPGPGPIINIPTFNFAVYSPGNIPAGTYNIGIACTLGPASATQLDKYWNVQLTFSTDPADSPAQVTWVVTSTAPTTTTSTTAPTTTTSTTAPTGTTTTTTHATTTTTTAPTTTTSTTAPTGTTTTTTHATTTTMAPTGTTTTTALTTTTTHPATTTTTGPTTTSTTVPTNSTTTTAPSTTTTTSGGGSTTSTTAPSQATVTNAAGNPIAPGGNLNPGQQITVSASGFNPGETTSITVQSDPITIGSAVADSAGKVTATVTLPTALEPGSHTLTISGATHRATFVFNVSASSGNSGVVSNNSGGTNSSSTPLAFTGSDPLKIVFWALLLVIFGRLAMVLGRPPKES